MKRITLLTRVRNRVMFVSFSGYGLHETRVGSDGVGIIRNLALGSYIHFGSVCEVFTRGPLLLATSQCLLDLRAESWC